MDTNILERKFEKIGAQVKIKPDSNRGLRLNVTTNRKKGEVFELDIPQDTTLEVIDIQPNRRHLLLMARQPGHRPGIGDDKTKYLCGHDERHWFIAGVSTSATSVLQAMELLKPQTVRTQQSRLKVKSKDRSRRKNAAYIRQGEWFFVPVPNMAVPKNLILENEPIQRGRSKPHICRYLYRTGGETVHVNFNHPNGLTEKQFARLSPEARKDGVWRVMRRNAGVYVSGWVSHPDHKTITLNGWHRVEMSQEQSSSRFGSANAFLD